MACLDAALAQLVRAHAVDAPHHDIAEHDGKSGAADQLEVQLEAGVVLKARHIRADDRDLLHAGLSEGAADKADVVGGAAAAAGLGHDDGRAVQVIFA